MKQRMAVATSGKSPFYLLEFELNEKSERPPVQSIDTPSGPAVPPSAPPPAGWSPVRILLCVVLVSLLISLSTVCLYDRFMAQKVVAVDLQGFLVEQKELYLRGEIDDVALKDRMDHLEQFVAALPERYAVVLGDVVVRNIEVIKP